MAINIFTGMCAGPTSFNVYWIFLSLNFPQRFWFLPCRNWGLDACLNSPVDKGQMIVEPCSDKETWSESLFCSCPSELNSFPLKSLSFKTICCPSSGLVFPVCPEGMPFSGGPRRWFSAQEASGACDISLRCFVRVLLIGSRDTPPPSQPRPAALPPTPGPQLGTPLRCCAW